MTNPASTDRPLKPAILRGVRLKCPNCGAGPLMKSFLKTRDTCAVCGEELFHHRADDGPAYLTIMVSGHLLAPMLLIVFTTFRPDPLLMAIGFVSVFVTLALFLLPRFKGLFVAIQWAKRMHGFQLDGSHNATGSTGQALPDPTI
jgi:uncharacterized protein (DUF983 family)